MAYENLTAALRDFVDAINSTGGATVDPKGYTVPVADMEWIDLGMAYEKACKALGVEPKIDDTLYEEPSGAYFDDPEGADCPHCGEHSTDPNHAAKEGPFTEA